MKNNSRSGQRLHEIREHRNISQGRIAKAIGVSVGTIQHYEQGRTRIPIERLEQLARALQCEPADLLAPPEAPPPSNKKTPAGGSLGLRIRAFRGS